MFDNLFQFIVVVVVILAILALIVVGFVNIFKPTIDDERYEVITVRVDWGDTLWDYYSEYANKADWIEWLDKVQELNGMRDSYLNAGEHIKIYAER